MKKVFKDAIDHGDIVILKQYVYLNFIAYKYKEINRVIGCHECDAYNECSLILLKGDKNNINQCMFVKGMDKIRFHYEMIREDDLSLFLSRYLLRIRNKA